MKILSGDTILHVIEDICKDLSLTIDHSSLRKVIKTSLFPINNIENFTKNLEILGETVGVHFTNFQLSKMEMEKHLDHGVTLLLPYYVDENIECIALNKKNNKKLQYTLYPKTNGNNFEISELDEILSILGDIRGTFRVLVPEPMSPLKVLEHKPKNSRFSIFENLLEFVKLDKKDVLTIVVYGMAAGVFNLIVPISTASLINTIAMETLVQPLVVLTLSLLIFLGLSGFMKVMQTIATEVIQKRMMVRLSFEFMYKISGVDRNVTRKTFFPELSNRIFEISSLQKGIELLLLDGLVSVLTIIIGLVVIAIYHSVFLVFDLFILSFLYLVIFIPLQSGYETRIKQSKQKYKIAHWIQEIARKPFILSNSSKIPKEKLEDLNRDYIYYREKHFAIVLKHITGLHSLQAIGSAIVLGLGGFLVLQNQLTLGQLVAAEFIIMAVMAEFSKLGKYIEVTYDMFASIDKISHVIDLPPKKESANLPPNPDKPFEIKLSGVKYPKSSHKSLNLELKAGQKYALFLDPEMEKSSLIDFISHRQNHSSGQILLNTIPIQTLSRSFLEQRIVLLRSIEVFEGSVLDNIIVGKFQDLENITNILKKLGLLEELNQFQDGIHTLLNPLGEPLSIRQLRLLMIARLLTFQPGLVLVDGFLESFPEKEVSRILDIFFESPCTLVVSSNRKFVCEKFPEVFQFNDGNLELINPKKISKDKGGRNDGK